MSFLDDELCLLIQFVDVIDFKEVFEDIAHLLRIDDFSMAIRREEGCKCACHL
jgi:hypothetical protein